MTQQEEIYLLHYGKKGMKWGVRRQKIKAAKSIYKKGKKNANTKYDRMDEAYDRKIGYSKSLNEKERAKNELIGSSLSAKYGSDNSKSIRRWNEARNKVDSLTIKQSSYEDKTQRMYDNEVRKLKSAYKLEKKKIKRG